MILFDPRARRDSLLLRFFSELKSDPVVCIVEQKLSRKARKLKYKQLKQFVSFIRNKALYLHFFDYTLPFGRLIFRRRLFWREITM